MLSAPLKASNSTRCVSKSDRHSSSLLLSARAARSPYFKAIKKAKRDHWCELLAAATLQTMGTAKRLVIGHPPPRFQDGPGSSTPLELNGVLLNYCCPGNPVDDPNTILLPFTDAIVLQASEMDRALAGSSHSSVLGPDMTTN